MAEKKDPIRSLIENGRRNGKLTNTEIGDAMEESGHVLDVEQMEKLYEELESNGIEVVDDDAMDASDVALGGDNVDDFEDSLNTDGITIDAMRALSEKYNADIVVVPVVQTWYWRQYQFFFRFDGEIVTDCAYYLSVYAYDRKQDTLKSYSSRGRERESASILNNPYEILGKAMDEVLAKLPYKRIPTDIEAVRGSISKLDVKTTEGGAKIITNELPIPVTQ